VLGDPESISRISQKDLQSFYDRHYTPANISVVSVGGLRLQEVLNIISESSLASEKPGVRTPLPIAASFIAPPTETRHVFELSRHTQISLESGGYESTGLIPATESPYTIDILEQILSNVLTEEIRKKRTWTYHIGCSVYYHRHFSEFGVICDSFKLDALDEIEEVIEQCIASLARREDLFQETKHRLIMRLSMIDPSGCDIRNHALDHLSDYQRIIPLTERKRGLEGICQDDIQRSLQWLIPSRRYTLIRKP
jgi:predicted Zn-dependent peptidase